MIAFILLTDRGTLFLRFFYYYFRNVPGCKKPYSTVWCFIKRTIFGAKIIPYTKFKNVAAKVLSQPNYLPNYKNKYIKIWDFLWQHQSAPIFESWV